MHLTNHRLCPWLLSVSLVRYSDTYFKMSGDTETDACRLSVGEAEMVRDTNAKASSSDTSKTRGTTSKTRRTSVEDGLMRYRVTRNGSKRAIVINIKQFSEPANQRLPSRQFSEVDENMFSTMLEQLGFEIFTKHDLTAPDLREFFLDLQGWDYRGVDVLAIVLMSYGDNRNIYTADGDMVDISHLMDFLKGNNCPDLAGVPKIVFINAGPWEEAVDDVVGDSMGDDVVDAMAAPAETEPPEERRVCVPKESDFLYVYSPVTHGHERKGRLEQGNIFLTTLSELCLRLQVEELEVCDLLTRTNRLVAYRVANTSTIPPRPCFFLSTLTKELFLRAK